jgi:phosphonate degradation associated HDIG domain protein
LSHTPKLALETADEEQAMTDFRALLIDIYSRRASGRYGLSDVNQLEHALQSAMLAIKAKEPSSFVVAALLHDVGHMIRDVSTDASDGLIDDNHEARAAVWLGRFFEPEIVEPIRLHVAAKRYLCAVEPGYLGLLAADSVRSLRLQGGPMQPAEASAFARQPYFDVAIRLRRIDDQAKDAKAETPPFDHYLAMIDEALSTKRNV